MGREQGNHPQENTNKKNETKREDMRGFQVVQGGPMRTPEAVEETFSAFRLSAV